MILVQWNLSIKDIELKGHFGTLNLVLIIEVPAIQRSFNTLQYYIGTQNGVLIIEVSAIQRFVIERFHCIYFHFGHFSHCVHCVHMEVMLLSLDNNVHLYLFAGMFRNPFFCPMTQTMHNSRKCLKHSRFVCHSTMHTYVHTHARTHARTHAHTHTHTHTHTLHRHN